MTSNLPPTRLTTLRSVLTVLVAFCGLSLLWNMPADLEGFGWKSLAPVSLELVVIVTALALVPRLLQERLGVCVAVLIAVATSGIAVLKVAEMTVLEVLDRPFNPLLDARLARALVDLLADGLGPAVGGTAVAALMLAPLVIGAASFGAVRGLQRTLHGRVARHVAAAACGVLMAVFASQHVFGAGYSVVANDASLTLLRYARVAEETTRAIAQIEAEVADDRFRNVASDRMLAGLRGADVLLFFVESYGRSVVESPQYAELTATTLAAFEERLAARGLASVSGWLTSPSAGGQSWLPTATLGSGLWLADQARYDSAMQSERLTLVRAFTRAGYRTVALKPAVTRPWPEGTRLGFSRLYAAADLGYAGKPYNWVTMPDQYTLSVLQRAERRRTERPLFAEVSLISSHWPWTPIAPVLDDWSTIGDGHIFSRWADTGDPPETMWNDPVRLRRQYALSIDYVLRVLASYAASFADERTLLVIVGDHQPARVLTGEGASRDVPMHVISADHTLLAPFAAWGFRPGMRPGRDRPPKRMDAFRDFFLEAFTTMTENGEPSR